MTGRELDRRFVEQLRAIQLTVERDADEVSNTYVNALLDEACQAILVRGCTRVDVLLAMSQCTPPVGRVDPWLEVPTEKTQPETPSAKRLRFWPFT
jgi:hypothetical protein